jgi:acetyltransferase-like isoleucine patch superfamily enzyme
MTEPANPSPLLERLLADFAALVDSDTLVGNADGFLNEASRLVESVYATGSIPSPADPFKGRTPEPEPDPDLFYTMFWRMFDRTPASMVQSFAIPLRRILAQKIFKHCGEGVIFHHNVLFSKGSNISIGDWSLINRYVMLDDRAAIDIGSFVMVAAGVTIETHTHPFDDFTVPIAYGGRSGLPVSVGSNSVVGYNTVLMAGVQIGYRCIIGANSVVTKDVPDYTVVGGVPAKPIKQYLPPESGEIWTPADGRPDGV